MLLGQDYPDIETIVIDNASGDGTRNILKDYETRLRITYNSDNVGFASGQNQAIRLSRGEWVLALNPDVRLLPDFVTKMLAAGESDESIGSVSGKLLAMPASFEIPSGSDSRFDRHLLHAQSAALRSRKQAIR